MKLFGLVVGAMRKAYGLGKQYASANTAEAKSKVSSSFDDLIGEVTFNLEGHSEMQALLNLLIVIHRDGGQYTITHGLEKSAKDATEIVLSWLNLAKVSSK